MTQRIWRHLAMATLVAGLGACGVKGDLEDPPKDKDVAGKPQISDVFPA